MSGTPWTAEMDESWRQSQTAFERMSEERQDALLRGIRAGISVNIFREENRNADKYQV
ncbi:unnamed protein product [Amoebophrya sp. A25]|nr:unnamed protein product [Amoebophrya sp. A25]|eukprot:GSA25T00012211001.1